MTAEPRPAGRVFLAPETPQPQRRAVAERLMADHPEVFGKPEDAIGRLRSIHLPASLRWAFLNNGKAGTSSAGRFLFQLEFGVPLTVDWDVPHDINPHSRPQIIGRLEDMGTFCQEVADQLGQPLPSGFDVRAANRQTYGGDRSAWLTPEARDRIATIYAADFDWLGYDPGGEA